MPHNSPGSPREWQRKWQRICLLPRIGSTLAGVTLARESSAPSATTARSPSKGAGRFEISATARQQAKGVSSELRCRSRKADCDLYRRRTGSRELPHLRLCLVEPGPHVHLAVHHRRDGEIFLCRFALAHAPVVRTVRSRHSPPRANSPCPDAGEPEVEVRRNAEEMIASSASARSAVNPEVAGPSPVEPAIKWPWGVVQHYVDHRVD